MAVEKSKNGEIAEPLSGQIQPLHSSIIRVSSATQNRTIVCIGSGPSLTVEDVTLCRQSSAAVLAINDAIDLAPWADYCFSADFHWWDGRKGLPKFKGEKYSMEPFRHYRYRLVTVLKNGGPEGLSQELGVLCTGQHSGYAAINLAVQFGFTKIVLLGYDMQPDGDRHHYNSPLAVERHPGYETCLKHYESLPEPLTRLGIQVFNASRRSALTTFPCVALADALR